MNLIRKRLRDVIFGLQDGLVSTSGALVGIAVGTQSSPIVALSGLVIVTVESLSMSAGSFLSAKSQREYLESLLKEEEEAIANNPEGERREIWQMYRARGFKDNEIKMLEKRLFSDKKLLLEDMAHKELGICPNGFEKPFGNAIAMGTAYVVGGLVPVAPYLFLPLQTAVLTSVLATVGALFIIGGLKGKLVRMSWWKSGLEMLYIAGLGGLAGFAIGAWAKQWIS